MGEWKKSMSVSFDAQSRGTLAWAKERFAPLFDEERSQSLMLRFILKQWETYTKVMLAMPDIMQAFVRAQQQLNLPKVAQCVIEFPVAHVTGETDGLAICKGDAGPFPMKRSASRLWIHLRAVADVGPEAYRSPFSQRSYMARRVA